ncbi:MAG: small subunit ribosomal protein S6 [Chloroflexi bacterium]|jgi:small subunit ribosomal protein S6|nr:MAG: small subunit ribosomal protein S6 [Chloroflexota bacterium]
MLPTIRQLVFFSRRILVTELTTNYELIAIYSPEASQTETDESLEIINTYVSSNDGIVSEHDQWGMKRFAFPIKKFTEGNYSLIKFSILSDKINELNRMLQMNETILRHLIVKV